MAIVTLGRLLQAAKSDAVIGISDRTQLIDVITRATELAAYKSNYNPSLGVMDICSDPCGCVTFPSIIGTVLQLNAGGYPTVFRSQWYQWHINGFGDKCGVSCGFSTDLGWSPVFQDLKEWSVVCALCEDPIDGNGSLEMIVEGETQDAALNTKEVLTIPATGPSSPGIRIPLLTGVANTPTPLVWFRKITRVTKPITRGYVKLVAFPVRQFAQQVTLGYYAPHETEPNYRRVKVPGGCTWVRVKFRKADIPLVHDYDVVNLGSYQAAIDLIKSIRLSDANNVTLAEVYLNRAVRLLNEVQSAEDGSTYAPMQVSPDFSIGTLDPR